MYYSVVAAALSLPVAQAFSDSSPFVLFSTSQLSSVSNNAQLQTSKQVTSSVKELMASCPTTQYVLVSQPNVHAADIRDGDGRCLMPHLCAAVKNSPSSSRFSVAEVVGQIELGKLKTSIKDLCAKQGKTAHVQTVEMRHLPSAREKARRAEILADSDHELHVLLDTLERDYTVLFFSDPNDSRPYEPDFFDPVHMDLKRQSEPLLTVRAKDNSKSRLPLFEKYQFFTPGIFMSLLVLILLLSILGTGLKALASLQVPYGAFEKEMGPAAQKKNM